MAADADNRTRSSIPPEAPQSAAGRRPTDAELVDRARAGDKEAFGQLVRRHQARLHRLVTHVVRNAPCSVLITS